MVKLKHLLTNSRQCVLVCDFLWHVWKELYIRVHYDESWTALLRCSDQINDKNDKSFCEGYIHVDQS